jgi:hypothetical protein
MPGLLVNDTFTGLDGTTLDKHHSDIGGSWTPHPNTTVYPTYNIAQLAANRLRLNATSLSCAYYCSEIPESAEGVITFVVSVLSTGSTMGTPGVFARADISSATANTLYFCRANIGGNTIDLIAIVNGTATTVGTASVTWTVGDHTIVFNCANAAKTVSVDGTQVISTTDNSITGLNRFGIRIGGASGDSATTGAQITSLSYVDSTVNAQPTPAAPDTNRLVTNRIRRRPRNSKIAQVPLPVTLDQSFNINTIGQDNLWTDGTTQYWVGLDSNLHPQIAKRTLPGGSFGTPFDLSTVSGNPFNAPVQEEDIHNCFVVATSTDGYIHVLGNMHDVPARYAVSAAGSITSWATGTLPSPGGSSLSYPTFIRLSDGTLVLFMRLGVSANGDLYCWTWNATTHAWSSPIEVVNGEASSESFYPDRFVPGPSDIVHVFGSWRASSGSANTNSDLTHCILDFSSTLAARKIDGTSLTLPVQHTTMDMVLHTAASGSGILNGCGGDIDTAGHPHFVSFLYDGNSATQWNHIYHDGTSWHVVVATAFTFHEDLTAAWVDPILARPQVACDSAGNTFLYGRTNKDGRRGHWIILDVTPGKASPLPELVLDGTDTHYAEVACDYRALKTRNELHMVLAPAPPVNPANPDWNRLGQWRNVPGRVITVAMSDLPVMAAALFATTTIINNGDQSHTVTPGPNLTIVDNGDLTSTVTATDGKVADNGDGTGTISL